MIDKIIDQLLEAESGDDIGGKDDWFEPGIQMLSGSGKEATWVYHNDRTWQIHTQAKNHNTLIVTTPHRPVSLRSEPTIPAETAFYEIIKGLLDNMLGFDHLVFVLMLGETYEAMVSAIQRLDHEKLIRIDGRSGMAVSATILYRNRHVRESEDDFELDSKEAAMARPEMKQDVGSRDYLYDPQGRAIQYSRNLRGIRQYVSRAPVSRVEIEEVERMEGAVKITFSNGNYWLGRFADYGVLKQALRTWRNLYGANLVVNGTESGKIGYRNPALTETYDDEAFDSDQAKEIGMTNVAYSLDDMKAAEPEFFSRKNNRFFGTKKIYKYGNFLVLKNRRRSHGYLGNMQEWTSYVIYEFIITNDSPKGLLLHKGSTGSLADAKEMIKKNDFRSRRERVADELEQWKAQRAQQNPQQEARDEDYN